MKFLYLLPTLLFWTGSTDTGFAMMHRNNSCHNIYQRCLANPNAKADLCKTLYDASVREGGVWGSPAARTATKTSGGSLACLVE